MKLKKIFFLITLFAISQIAFSQKQNYRCRIVDYGGDMGSGSYRNTQVTSQTTYKEDVDGDGSSTDDCIAYWKYSFTEPMNPTVMTYQKYATNSIFYGGYTGFMDATGKSLTEGLINENHELRDDWNMMNVQSVTSVRHRDYGFWFWKKDNFLNGGATDTVTFDSNSLLLLRLPRYWTGIEGGRWVVRDGDQFYMSRAIYNGGRMTHGLRPDTTLWAPYNPVEPYDVRFNAATAVWAPHSFTNISAVGFYFFRDNLITGNIQIKWHAFEVYANVKRAVAPSFYTPMAQIPANGSITNTFYISNKEITYDLWQKVWNWAVSNQYCVDLGTPGYVFHKDGDMGNMDAKYSKHFPAEPVTDISWYDAVIWCNALSELEGLTPCYYDNAAKTNVLRTVRNRIDSTKTFDKYDVYVNYSANGYRLPTLEEWTVAAGNAQANESSAWIASNSDGKTQLAGTKSANNFGLYDMIGNVWEYCWDTPNAADNYSYASQTTHTVLGGSYNYPDNTNQSVKKWGDIPWNGNPNIGFRIVRAYNGAIPPITQNTAGMPVWTFADNTKILPVSTPAKVNNLIAADVVKIAGTKTYKTVGDPLYENDNTGFIRSDDAVITVTPFYMSKYETSFAKWNEIINWGEMNGYTFDSDGDMGCMDYRADVLPHSAYEPVTDLSWNDLSLWCNALSEYEGRIPVYYSDTARTKVFRKGVNYRIAMDQSYDQIVVGGRNMYSTVYTRYEKDGYRLPTEAEWEVAYRAGNETKNYGAPSNAGSYSWVAANAGDSTHTVTTGMANALGIYHLGGNVSEWINGARSYDYYLNHNPKETNIEPLFGMTYRGGNYISSAFTSTEMKQIKASEMRPYVGFRVVRCDLNEHPQYTSFTPDIKINFVKTDYNALQGSTFHANLKRTGEFSKTGVPQAQNALRWSYATGGVVQSSPVVVNGILYVGSDDYNVYALNATTGALIWKYLTGGAVKSSATVFNNNVFIGSNDGYLYCLNATSGTLVWRTKAYTTGTVKSSPVVLYNTVFATWGGMWEVTNTVGLDINTGLEKWRFRASRVNESGMSADSVQFVFPSGDNMLSAADIATEIRQWKATGFHNDACMPIIDDNYALYGGEGYLTAFNRKTGVGAWTYNVGSSTDALPKSTPAIGTIDSAGISKRIIFWGNLKKSFHAVTLNGKKSWSRTFTQPIKSSPALANNVVYVGCDDSTMYALDAATGSTIWTYKTGKAIYSSPWVENGFVYFGSDDGKVYAIVADTLAAINNTKLSIETYPNPVVNTLTINTNEDYEYVRIISSTGQILLNSNKPETGKLNLNSLRSGSYFIELYRNNKSIYKGNFLKK